MHAHSHGVYYEEVSHAVQEAEKLSNCNNKLEKEEN
jgi:hypothetical protein